MEELESYISKHSWTKNNVLPLGHMLKTQIKPLICLHVAK